MARADKGLIVIEGSATRGAGFRVTKYFEEGEALRNREQGCWMWGVCVLEKNEMRIRCFKNAFEVRGCEVTIGGTTEELKSSAFVYFLKMTSLVFSRSDVDEVESYVILQEGVVIKFLVFAYWQTSTRIGRCIDTKNSIGTFVHFLEIPSLVFLKRYVEQVESRYIL